LRLYEGLYERLVPSLLQGHLDFAILSVFGSEISKELTVRRLLQTSMVIVARRRHPKARARRLAELGGQAWVFSGPVGSPGATVMRLFGNAGLTPPKAAVTCDTLMQVSALLLSTDYLALLPRLVLERGLLPNELVEIKLSDALLQYELCLVQRRSVPLTPLAATLARMLTASVADMRSKT
jgi:LysR family transcriptional regulator of abg operon